MCRRKEKRKPFLDDDGSTIADMNVEGFHWYQNARDKARRSALNQLSVTRKERWAMIWGGLLAYLPVFLIILVSFGITFLLLFYWISRHGF